MAIWIMVCTMDNGYHNAMLIRRSDRMQLSPDYMEVNYITYADPAKHAYIDTKYAHESGTTYAVNVSADSSSGARVLGFGMPGEGWTGQKLGLMWSVEPSGSSLAGRFDCWYLENVGQRHNIKDVTGKQTTLVLDAVDNAARAYYNGSDVTTTGSYTVNSDRTIKLFTTHPENVDAGAYFGGKLYWCRMIKDGQFVRNYIPVVRLSDGEVGLYDLAGSISSATGTPFYKSANDNKFTWG